MVRCYAGLHAVDILLSAAFEARNQFVGLARIEKAHSSQRPCATPGVPFDHEAGCADRNVQCRRCAIVGRNRADRMLGFGPWDMVEQPRAGWVDGKIRRTSFGDRLEINQSVLDGERHVIGTVAAGDRKSTRLNSSHLVISYAVFCLKKKKILSGANETGDTGPKAGV